MTLQEFLDQLVDEILQSKSLEEVRVAVTDAKNTLERSNITYTGKEWFWAQLKERLLNHNIILKEAQAAAALNDLVAYALATIQQVSGVEQKK
ncbi:hypothetical protein N7X28_22760 [Bacillus sp. SM-B1]|uniref:hypothetical protein n=1 Tax=Bacillus sp. SM-B1 TaxID=2980102 RepID=UPI00294A15B5|nr:hypothetical protein [Bacillus sp. SM-B1]MDV6039289.1 hypothetical protein [Bacillus sp. SM-B1]